MKKRKTFMNSLSVVLLLSAFLFLCCSCDDNIPAPVYYEGDTISYDFQSCYHVDATCDEVKCEYLKDDKNCLISVQVSFQYYSGEFILEDDDCQITVVKGIEEYYSPDIAKTLESNGFSYENYKIENDFTYNFFYLLPETLFINVDTLEKEYYVFCWKLKGYSFQFNTSAYFDQYIQPYLES